MDKGGIQKFTFPILDQIITYQRLILFIDFSLTIEIIINNFLVGEIGVWRGQKGICRSLTERRASPKSDVEHLKSEMNLEKIEIFIFSHFETYLHRRTGERRELWHWKDFDSWVRLALKSNFQLFLDISFNRSVGVSWLISLIGLPFIPASNCSMNGGSLSTKNHAMISL